MGAAVGIRRDDFLEIDLHPGLEVPSRGHRRFADRINVGGGGDADFLFDAGKKLQRGDDQSGSNYQCGKLQ